MHFALWPVELNVADLDVRGRYGNLLAYRLLASPAL
jgi:hypothetical protein